MKLITTPHELIDAMSQHFHTPKHLIISDWRRQELVLIRQAICYYSVDYLKTTLKGIGYILNRDHTTVIYARDRFRIATIHSDPAVVNFKAAFESEYYFNTPSDIKRIDKKLSEIQESEQQIQINALLNRVEKIERILNLSTPILAI